MNPHLKFKYVLIKHPNDFAVHEAFSDISSKIIAVKGEPLTLYGYSPKELKDIVNAISVDIKTAMPINGDCEDLYSAWDKITENAYDYSPGQAEILKIKN